MGTIFIAGAYGVGKSTLAKELSSLISLPNYSASSLIGQVNGEEYSKIKTVLNKYSNQDILEVRVNQILQNASRIILTGHFCIMNEANEVERLPKDIFKKLSIECILLLEAAPTIIADNLFKRDGVLYSLEFIESLLREERRFAEETSVFLSCPLVIHQMNYQCNNVQQIFHLLDFG